MKKLMLSLALLLSAGVAMASDIDRPLPRAILLPVTGYEPASAHEMAPHIGFYTEGITPGPLATTTASGSVATGQVAGTATAMY